MSEDNTTGRRITASRRAVLRAAGASGLAFAATGAASARHADLAAMNEAAASYDSTGSRRAAVETYADGAVAALADRGVVAGLDAFDFGDADVTGLLMDDRATAQVVASTRTATHEVEVVARPQIGEAYATARRLDGGGGVTATQDDDGVTTQGCYTEHRCSSSECVDDIRFCQYEERQCCDYDDCTEWTNDGCCNC
jgi:hypothetical protein